MCMCVWFTSVANVSVSMFALVCICKIFAWQLITPQDRPTSRSSLLGSIATDQNLPILQYSRIALHRNAQNWDEMRWDEICDQWGPLYLITLQNLATHKAKLCATNINLVVSCSSWIVAKYTYRGSALKIVFIAQKLCPLKAYCLLARTHIWNCNWIASNSTQNQLHFAWHLAFLLSDMQTWYHMLNMHWTSIKKKRKKFSLILFA